MRVNLFCDGAGKAGSQESIKAAWCPDCGHLVRTKDGLIVQHWWANERNSRLPYKSLGSTQKHAR